MQTSNAKQNFRPDDPLWVLLADLSLGDFLSDHDQIDGSMAGYLFQMVRELGMPLECVENIATLVTEFANVSPGHHKPEGLEFPARIRIFCQKRIMDDANAVRATSKPYQSEQVIGNTPKIPDFGANMNGGWGCFLIKRAGNVSDDSRHFVDLYLYREG